VAVVVTIAMQQLAQQDQVEQVLVVLVLQEERLL
jgi:hypothetical protein